MFAVTVGLYFIAWRRNASMLALMLRAGVTHGLSMLGVGVAFESEITLNRKDYGLNWNAALETGGFLVGDDVKVSLSIQAA